MHGETVASALITAIASYELLLVLTKRRKTSARKTVFSQSIVAAIPALVTLSRQWLSFSRRPEIALHLFELPGV